MRHSNHAVGGPRLPSLAAGLIALLAAGLLAACAPAAAASSPPSPVPTPSPSPDPHLTEPVTADQIFRALAAAKTGIVANNANSGGGNPDVLKRINAEIANWPLRITEYRSSAVLAKALRWKAGAPPVRNQPPYAFAGFNVLVEFGPISTARAPSTPDAGRQKLAESIAAALDPLLWPLAQHSVVAVAGLKVAAAASAAPASASKAPGAAP